jgi:DNA-binding GntR family transcriptional regulator
MASLHNYYLMRRENFSPFNLVPKYYPLAEILKQRQNKIWGGVWRPHETLPSERKLGELYKLSRTKIRSRIY